MPSSHFGHFKKDLGPIEEQLAKSLFNPLHEYLTRPRPFFRGQLTTLGFEMGGGGQPSKAQQDLMQRAGQAIESLYAGALIVEDVQDELSTRQGLPSLHEQIGSPLALNASNWLDFFAYRLILDSEVSDAVKTTCLREVTEALLKAHQGHALDLSIRMSQQARQDAPQICRQSLEWKAGALLELALVLGARIAGCEGPRLNSLRMLGRELGVTLQMFQDLRNLELDEPDEKHLEDLILQRPSFLWWIVADEFPDQWGSFKEALLPLPRLDSLEFFLEMTPVIQKGRAKALAHQQWTFQNFAALGGDLTSPAFQKIEALAEKIAGGHLTV